jgi:hypothetical protein
MDKILPVVKVEDEFIPEYSDSEMLCSNEVQIPYKPVVFKPVNPPIGMPIHQTNSVDKGKSVSNEYYSAPTGCGTMIDPFLHRNFSSSALSITPPSDQVAISNFPGNTPTAETTNFLQHHQESHNQVVNTFLATNLNDRLMRVPGPGMHVNNNNFLSHVVKMFQCNSHFSNVVTGSNNIFGEKGSSSDQKGNNNVIKLMDEQQSDHAQPNSSSPTSKKSKHMQVKQIKTQNLYIFCTFNFFHAY